MTRLPREIAPTRSVAQLEWREVLRNPTTGEVRVTFALGMNAETYVVVKFFDTHQLERHTMKIFVGTYEKVRSHWKTLTVVDHADSGHEIYVRAAVNVIGQLAAVLCPND